MQPELIPAINIPIALVDVPADHRKVHPDAAQALAENTALHGQRQPIEVIETAGRYRLVFGATRLAAAGINNWTALPAIVKQPEDFKNEAGIRLVTIAENFYHRSLTALDRSVDIADWCAIKKATQPQVKPGPKPARLGTAELSANLALNSADTELADTGEAFAVSFSEAAQNALGLSRRSVFRALKIASLAAELRDRIALHAIADNQQELLSLAGEPFDRQAKIVDLILAGEVGSVAQALDALAERPIAVVRAPWEKVSDRFTRLKPTEQDSFFQLHEAAVLRWTAERKRK
ncbi:ParB/RepB/Spo0J family partition protein [Pararhizobium sp.]|uniref:ParB/RepB/Spo0J family partition protein n=1 Tax=Pararhizobium sp. TaxID=1977563 RepID=UPI003D0F3D1D